ncbi:Lrp/AsnC family transcriptional regulator [Stappia sp.]|jgi:Lrp/AsnC family leucine-responsive transcriptional regulator|uniref:Lrp/AsnC family transcriptional regulator n=1 Tax=Stappia sp. TaxID=1870903 RepID=UPI003A997A13
MARQLDEIDRRILKALVDDGRLSNTELARKVGLSPSPCWQRVRRLEEEGIITGYTAVLDQEALGMGDTVMIEVSLDRHNADTLESFGQSMAALPDVLEVHMMAGEYDYFVKVAASGTKGVERFLREQLFGVEGLRNSRSSFSLRCLKRVTSCVPDEA